MMSKLLGERQQGLIFIVSAPAGTGKTTLVNKLLKEFPSIVANVSYTTRKPREGEIQGIDYHFINEPAFEAKIAVGDFFEYVKLYGAYYGTSFSWIKDQQNKGKDIVLVIDTQGALQLKEKLLAHLIFICPPSLETLRARLLQRHTETLDMVDQRMERAKMELIEAKHYDYKIINDDLETAYQILRSIFIAEGHRIRSTL